MIIKNFNLGRLGNSIFRSLANIVFFIIYDNDGIISNENINFNIHMNDVTFLEWSNNILSDNIPYIDKNSIIYFDGYYQHDKIYLKYKKQIIEYIKNHNEFELITDRNEKYKFIDLINYKNRLYYDIVVHLRLEDFIQIGFAINPLSIKKVIDQIIFDEKSDKICFVINQPKTELENKYLKYLLLNYNNCIIESNDVLTDFHIMKNAKILVCSCSTLSWTASLFSVTLKKVYIPDYNHNRIHETFKNPINNTILYKYEQCNFNSLNILLDNLLDNLSNKNYIKIPSNIIGVSFSGCDSKGKELDYKLDNIINKTNGFFIELGAHDGLMQSNTAYFEFTKNWNGILIEPSKNAYEQCINNRTKCHVVNYCCVSDEYHYNKINGDFNGVTMSSVDGSRLNNNKLIEVDSIQLEKILDTYFMCYNNIEIDFLSLDVEGYEYNVLKGLNLNKYKPKYILIEIYISNYDMIIDLLNKNNYELHSNFTNYNKYDNPGWDETHNDYLFVLKLE